MAVVESFDAHEHPALDVGTLKHERAVFDDGFEISVEELEHEVKIRLVGEDIQELGGGTVRSC